MKYIFLLLTVTNIAAYAQTISYTRQGTRIFASDAVVLIPEVGSRQHLLISSPGKPAKLEVYNNQLGWLKEQELPFSFSENAEVNILPFQNHYCLYHNRILHKVDVSGLATDQTNKLNTIIKSSFYDSIVSCELFNTGNAVIIYGFLYYPDIKKVVATVINCDSNLDNPSINRFVFDYDNSAEKILKMMIVPGNSLLVLKSQMTENNEFLLDILKMNIAGENAYSSNFKSLLPLANTSLLHSTYDSTITIFSTLGKLSFENRFKRRVMLATLDDTLGVKNISTKAYLTIPEGVKGAFVNINTGKNFNKWMPTYGPWNRLVKGNNPINNRFSSLAAPSIIPVNTTNNITVSNAINYFSKLLPASSGFQLVEAEGDVSFSLISDKSEKVYDTVIKWHKRYFIEVGQFASFSDSRKDYLVVKERFPSKGKSLLLNFLDDKGQLDTKKLHVYDKNYYSLLNLAFKKRAIYIPYIFKREVGMVKIDVSEL